MKEKNIIVFMPSIEGGGVEKNFFIITNFLSKKFDKITVINLSNNLDRNLDKKINLISRNNKYFKKLGRRLKFIISIFYLTKEILLNKDSVVFCFQGIAYCTLVCKLFSTKIIIRSNSSPTGWSSNFFKKKLYKIIYGMADSIIVNSVAFKKELKNKFNLESVCIYNPLNTKEIISKSKKKIHLNFFNKKNLNIISVARFSKQKDHECLVKSIYMLNKKIENVKLLLLGSGEEQKKIKNLVDKLNLRKNIKILNFKKNPYPYIRRAELFILSSNFEGLPNVLLEALVLNKFIISSNCPTGPSEILDRGKGGLLFKVGDYKSLYKNILFFKNNNKIINKKKDYAKKRLYRFDFNQNLLKYQKTICELK
tara:strand:- start:73 stop:1173 length:1101 start_codon:yes stop_codon:yes gene_type:complete